MSDSSARPPIIPILDVKEIGLVKDVSRGIVKVSGLPNCAYGQLVQFSERAKGIVMGFNNDEVLVVVLGGELDVSVGDTVTSLAEMLAIPVGNALQGRIVNPLGDPADGLGPIEAQAHRPIFREAPGVMEREPITDPLPTGTKIIDLAIPIGKGQRELIIGDRQTGKSSLALDAIISQKGRKVVCIYVWIGGPQQNLKKILHDLGEKDCLSYTIVVSAPAGSSAAEQYLAPYAGAAIGEHFMTAGRDVLVIFDDLTKHAWIYRQMSLLMERSPGREAYPGDIFFLHSQLLERAGRLKKESGGGTMTFLPIVETLQNDITGYIQTNLISITDGQIYLSSNLFREGFKPAIDLGLSVSRIGSKVQYPGVRDVSKGLRLEYAQYREMLRMTKLRTRLSAGAAAQLRRGEVLHELLIQPNGSPVSPAEMIILFHAFKKKVLEAVPPPFLKAFLAEFWRWVSEEDPALTLRLGETGDLTPDLAASLEKHYVTFFKRCAAAEAAGKEPA